LSMNTGSNFIKKRSSRLSLAPSIKFPVEAFTAENSTDFSNPDLYSELYPMAYSSASIFALAEVRKAARKGKINTGELDIVSTPVGAGSILKVFQRNQSFFQSYLKVADYDFMVSLVHSTDVDAKNNASDDWISNAEFGDQHQKKKALELINAYTIDYFGDDNADSECLYMVNTNPINKRIVLVFRGSTTLQDWVKDSKMIASEIQNPVADRPDQLPMIGVHLGFREYLYGESKSLTVSSTAATEIHKEVTTGKSTTVVTENDEKVEKVMEPVYSDKDAKDPESSNSSDLSTEDDNALATGNNDSEIVTTKQEDQKSTTDLLNFLGLDLLAIKEKQKSLRNSIKWNTLSYLPIAENEETLNENKGGPDIFAKFAFSKTRAKSQSRLARILDEVMHLQKQYDSYNIYVTGHSLGGALGLLAALEIAARFGKKERPVTFVGVGNPRSGTEGFRDAVEVLEREGKMRCISIHGRYDVVTMLPNSIFINSCSKQRFCQSGFELLLNAESSKFYMRRSERNDEKYLQRMGLALYRADKIQERHQYVTYLKELEALERPLKKLYLNDFYDKFVEQSIFPCSERKMTPMKVRSTFARKSLSIVEAPSRRELKRTLSADNLNEQVDMDKAFGDYDE